MDNRNDYTPLNNYDQPVMKAPEKQKKSHTKLFLAFVIIGTIIGVVLYFLLIKP